MAAKGQQKRGRAFGERLCPGLCNLTFFFLLLGNSWARLPSLVLPPSKQQCWKTKGNDCPKEHTSSWKQGFHSNSFKCHLEKRELLWGCFGIYRELVQEGNLQREPAQNAYSSFFFKGREGGRRREGRGPFVLLLNPKLDYCSNL